jgi:hypothetical protein
MQSTDCSLWSYLNPLHPGIQFTAGPSSIKAEKSHAVLGGEITVGGKHHVTMLGELLLYKLWQYFLEDCTDEITTAPHMVIALLHFHL